MERNILKKVNLLILGLGIIVIGGGSLSKIAHADDSKQTTAQVTIDAGDLTLTNVDNINFGSTTIMGSDIDLFEETATVSIEDFRGSSSKGWTLKAKLQEGDFNGMGLTFSPEITANSNTVLASTTQNLNTEDQSVASVSDDNILDTEFDTSMRLNAALNIPAKTKANSYRTTIVWNLSATPETK